MEKEWWRLFRLGKMMLSSYCTRVEIAGSRFVWGYEEALILLNWTFIPMWSGFVAPDSPHDHVCRRTSQKFRPSNWSVYAQLVSEYDQICLRNGYMTCCNHAQALLDLGIRRPPFWNIQSHCNPNWHRNDAMNEVMRSTGKPQLRSSWW